MATTTFKYTRLVGKKLTYDVEVLSNRYVIRLNGKLLREALSPVIAGGNVSELEAVSAFAIADIESLHGMPEE